MYCGPCIDDVICCNDLMTRQCWTGSSSTCVCSIIVHLHHCNVNSGLVFHTHCSWSQYSIECSCYSILIPRPCGLGMWIRLYSFIIVIMAHLKSGDLYCPIVVKSRCLLNRFLTLEVSTVLVPELKISTAGH